MSSLRVQMKLKDPTKVSQRDHCCCSAASAHRKQQQESGARCMRACIEPFSLCFSAPKQTQMSVFFILLGISAARRFLSFSSLYSFFLHSLFPYFSCALSFASNNHTHPRSLPLPSPLVFLYSKAKNKDEVRRRYPRHRLPCRCAKPQPWRHPRGHAHRSGCRHDLLPARLHQLADGRQRRAPHRCQLSAGNGPEHPHRRHSQALQRIRRVHL
ncbi:hypothetical protein BX070DRAFT_256977 [Coemansia spiralis]|nr:hypothetical protein BX070DRAFT_256977 [Coemansia spiralis]